MTHRTKAATPGDRPAPAGLAQRAFGDEADLLDFLGEVAVPRGGSVAVIAGRFRPAPAGAGEPAPAEEAMRAFRLGARLLHAGAMRSRARARIVALVDDHEPGTPGRGFPFEPLAIPAPFLEVLEREGLSAREALLPWSEADLRRRHLRGLERRDHADPRFAALRREARGSCAFAGEMLRLLLDAAARDMTDAVFLLPWSRFSEVALAADLLPGWAREDGLGAPIVHLVSCATPLVVASQAA